MQNISSNFMDYTIINSDNKSFTALQSFDQITIL
nr:MAG TPA: hypothetical protein [Caudoviricetes sp.]